MRPPVVDYRALRWSTMTTPRYRHLLLLLFWPAFGLVFWFLERGYTPPFYQSVYCPLDDWIPFQELFLIPYLFWFLFLVGIHCYTLLYEPQAFRKLMHFIMLTYGCTALIYWLFPTCQQLRPEQFARDNALTRLMAAYYQFDTNTNVLPSLHVVGSLAVAFTAWQCPRLKRLRPVIAAAAFLISISTVFLKQHSVLDVLAALILCLAAWPICFDRNSAARE